MVALAHSSLNLRERLINSLFKYKAETYATSRYCFAGHNGTWLWFSRNTKPKITLQENGKGYTITIEDNSEDFSYSLFGAMNAHMREIKKYKVLTRGRNKLEIYLSKEELAKGEILFVTAADKTGNTSETRSDK